MCHGLTHTWVPRSCLLTPLLPASPPAGRKMEKKRNIYVLRKEQFDNWREEKYHYYNNISDNDNDNSNDCCEKESERETEREE